MIKNKYLNNCKYQKYSDNYMKYKFEIKVNKYKL